MVAKGRLQPGRMFLVDTGAGRIVDDDEIKAELAAAAAVRRLGARRPDAAGRPARRASTSSTRHDSVLRRQQTFGYTEEELRILLAPMARTGAEPIGSMGTDTPMAVAVRRGPGCSSTTSRQLFAQVTNPPLDAIREELVTAWPSTIGPEQNLLDAGPGAAAGRSCCRSR